MIDYPGKISAVYYSPMTGPHSAKRVVAVAPAVVLTMEDS
jgi:hypothetical protein